MAHLGVAFCSKNTGLLLISAVRKSGYLCQAPASEAVYPWPEIHQLSFVSHNKDNPCSRLSPGEQHLLPSSSLRNGLILLFCMTCTQIFVLLFHYLLLNCLTNSNIVATRLYLMSPIASSPLVSLIKSTLWIPPPPSTLYTNATLPSAIK